MNARRVLLAMEDSVQHATFNPLPRLRNLHHVHPMSQDLPPFEVHCDDRPLEVEQREEAPAAQRKGERGRGFVDRMR